MDDLGRRRFDLIREVGLNNNGQAVLRAYPDPARYEWVDRDGKRLLFDRLDRAYLPEAMVKELLQFSLTTEPHNDQPAIPDAKAYVWSRREAFAAALEGQAEEPTFEDASDDFLRSLPSGDAQFVIMSIDLVGSTALSTALPAEAYTRIVAAVLTELSLVVPSFGGHVLKYTGDGFIAYFAAPNMVGKHDLAVDCALLLIRLITLTIKDALRERGYSELELRVGLDSGAVAVVTVGHPSTKQQVDLIGKTISLACKIQTLAPIGSIALGDSVLRSLHTNWRLQCQSLTTDSSWQYGIDGAPYLLYKLTPSFS